MEVEHPDEEKADTELLIQLLESFGGLPFRGSKCALPGHEHGHRQSIP